MKSKIFFLLILTPIFLSACNSQKNELSEPTLPIGYTLDSYTVEEVTDVHCKQDSDCETPFEYLVQSRCPFASKCLEGKCAVVCPDFGNTIEFQGKIIEMEGQMDGVIFIVANQENRYEVLASIPNLGPEYAPAFSELEVDKEIQVVGRLIPLGEKERIIASRLYVEAMPPEGNEHPCNLTPDPGACEAAIERYYFNKEEQKCKPFFWGGCDGVVPFDLLEVCRSTCE